jgi:hypothetical protein
MSLPLSAGLLSFGVPFRQSRLLNPTRRRSSKQNSSKPMLVKFLKCIRIRIFQGGGMTDGFYPKCWSYDKGT